MKSPTTRTLTIDYSSARLSTGLSLSLAGSDYLSFSHYLRLSLPDRLVLVRHTAQRAFPSAPYVHHRTDWT
jgi:hypothetical protein